MRRRITVIASGLFLTLPFCTVADESSCDVPGITARWVIAYCMARYETDDEAHAGVSDCFARELAELQQDHPDEDCAVNQVYKSAICALMIERRTYAGSLSACSAADETTPSVVEHGIR